MKLSYKQNRIPWDLSIFNGLTSDEKNIQDPMLLGVRGTISVSKNLKFEIVNVSQWKKNESSLLKELINNIIGNTNEGEFSNTNRIAGFGFSYKNNNNLIPMRFYGQIIGEDEVNFLPNCLIYLTGFEIPNFDFKFPTSIGLEFSDTRVNHTTNNNCGPNTAYNNNVYKYRNEGIVMGAPIDTEGKSIELYGSTKISKDLYVEYSIANVLINDMGWTGHNVSSKRQNGIISSINLSKDLNNINLNFGIYNQNFSLDNSKIKEGTGFNLSYKINF